MGASDFSLLRRLLLSVLVGFSCISMTESSDSSQLQTINKNKMGMEPLFDIVNIFLGDIIQTKNISDSFINLTTVFEDGDFDSDTLTDWNAWAKYLVGFAVCSAIGLLFIVVIPIAGFIFCCCRLCGKCGGKKRPEETKHSKCKRRTFCTLLVAFNTLALAGVICAFICNDLLYESLENNQSEGMIGHFQNSLNHIRKFADKSVQNVSDQALQTVSSVSDNVIHNINRTGQTAVNDALKMLNATANLEKAKDISKNVNHTLVRLEKVNGLLGNLTSETTTLQNNLTAIKDNVKSICTDPSNCNIDDGNFTTDANFSKLTDLSHQIENVKKSVDMQTFIDEAEREIANTSKNVETKVKDEIDKATESITKVNKSVTDGIRDLRVKKDDAVAYLNDATSKLNDTDETVKDYADYIYYGGIGICCTYLLIVLMYYIGLLYGLCGERPGDGAPCCNRGAGSKFLMAGISFTFILSWILMLLCLIMFVTGGLSYTEVCRYFVKHDPMDIKIFDKTLDNGLELSSAIFKNKSAEFSISNSLKQCQEDEAVYSAFKLQNVVDLDNITKLDSFKAELDGLRNKALAVDDVTLINDGLRTRLEEFANFGFQNISFEEYSNETVKNITKVDLAELASRLRQAAEKPSIPNNDKKILRDNADNLDFLANTTIPGIKSDIEILKTELNALKNEDSSQKEPINELIDNLNKSQSKFNSEKEELIKKAINDLADQIWYDTDKRVQDLKIDIKTNIGHCQPLSDAFFALTDSACVLVVDPLNGLWFSFGACLFCFVLCLIFAIPLSGLYRCEHKYEKEFDDPNYGMYGGPNPDTIPLTSVERMREAQQRYPHHHDHHHHSGMANSAYSPETKPYYAPPPYRESMHQGIAAYAYPPPPEYNGHQHHDLASAYPALHKDSRHRGHMDSYNYPY